MGYVPLNYVVSEEAAGGLPVIKGEKVTKGDRDSDQWSLATVEDEGDEVNPLPIRNSTVLNILSGELFLHRQHFSNSVVS